MHQHRPLLMCCYTGAVRYRPRCGCGLVAVGRRAPRNWQGFAVHESCHGTRRSTIASTGMGGRYGRGAGRSMAHPWHIRRRSGLFAGVRRPHEAVGQNAQISCNHCHVGPSTSAHVHLRQTASMCTLHDVRETFSCRGVGRGTPGPGQNYRRRGRRRRSPHSGCARVVQAERAEHCVDPRLGDLGPDPPRGGDRLRPVPLVRSTARQECDVDRGGGAEGPDANHALLALVDGGRLPFREARRRYRHRGDDC